MDFIDPIKQRQHKIRLFVGYGLISFAITLATIVLLFAAYGYGFNSNGEIIQSGLVFVSSAPVPASIFLNNQLNSAATNARLQIPAGQYTLQLTKAGYRPWVRSLGVEGGSIQHFDYPILFPTKIVTTVLKQFSAQPGLITQTPNNQWLLTQDSAASDVFSEYDLSNPKQIATTIPTTFSIPSTIFGSTDPTQSWQLVSWFSDNTHAILKRNTTSGSEYILFDRQTPSSSVNLTTTLKLDTTTTLSFYNNSFPQYYLYDSADNSLTTANISSPDHLPFIKDVITFDVYANNSVIYVTSSSAPSGEVYVNVLQGTQTFHIGLMQAGLPKYLVAMTQYSGNWYAAYGSSSEGKIYVYENPVASLQNQPKEPLVPMALLKISQPNYLTFSGNRQILAAENGGSFSTYDVLNQNEYSYNVSSTADSSLQATWMDNYHFTVVSSGQLLVLDYDGTNAQILQPAAGGLVTFFDPTHKWAYVITPDLANPTITDLTSTALRIPADQ